MDRRPDLFEKLETNGEADEKLLKEIKNERAPRGEESVFDCRRAEPTDVDAIMGIVAQAQKYLRDSGVDQWQDGYPDPGIFQHDISLGQGWFFTCGGRPAGYACLSMRHEKSYDNIDGAWLTEGDDYAVVHRAMVADEFRHTPLAFEMFSLAEDLAAGFGKVSVRVDTHRDNRAMNGLAGKLGFTFCGIVDVSLMDPGHDAKRNAYEKIIL
jgi:RimJ/RimL family protein N-acetyltransferase